MKKIRKHTQLSLINRKSAGRPAKVDIGIRHIRRERITRPSALHLTIKVRENKADIQKIIEKSPALFKLKEDLVDVLDEMKVFYLNAYYLWN